GWIGGTFRHGDRYKSGKGICATHRRSASRRKSSLWDYWRWVDHKSGEDGPNPEKRKLWELVSGYARSVCVTSRRVFVRPIQASPRTCPGTGWCVAAVS